MPSFQLPRPPKWPPRSPSWPRLLLAHFAILPTSSRDLLTRNMFLCETLDRIVRIASSSQSRKYQESHSVQCTDYHHGCEAADDRVTGAQARVTLQGVSRRHRKSVQRPVGRTTASSHYATVPPLRLPCLIATLPRHMMGALSARQAYFILLPCMRSSPAIEHDEQ